MKIRLKISLGSSFKVHYFYVSKIIITSSSQFMPVKVKKILRKSHSYLP